MSSSDFTKDEWESEHEVKSMSDLEKLGGLEAIELELAARNAMSPDHDRRRHNGIPVSNCMICIAQSLIARVRELERREINALFAGDPLEMKAKLRSTRELAEMVMDYFDFEKNKTFDGPATNPGHLKAKAREVLEKIK